MGRLVKFELYKIITNKEAMIILSLLLIANTAIVFSNQETSYWGIDAEQYRSTFIELNGYSEETILTLLHEKVEFQKINRDKNTVFFSNLLSELKFVNGYNTYLYELQENANKMAEGVIFQKQDKFALRNIKKTAADYKKMIGNELTFLPSEGVQQAVRVQSTNIILLLSTLCLCYPLFLYEKEWKLSGLTRPTYYGRNDEVAAKLVTLVMLCVMITILCYTCNLFIAGKLFGFCDSSARLQSLHEYRSSAWEITIQQFLFLYLLVKSAAVSFVAILCALLCKVCKKSNLVYLITTGGMGACFCCYQMIPATHPLSFFRYINIDLNP